MGRLIHISQFDPRKHEGGVAQFARHLKLAIPELKFIFHSVLREPWQTASANNENLLKHGGISEEDTVIADGYYSLGLAGAVDRLIVVCHSTYIGWLRDNLMLPYPQFADFEPWLVKAAEAQEQAYRQADQLVAVSSSAQEELWEFYRLESELIFNGVDVDLFQHDGEAQPGYMVEVAGQDFNKGADIISQLITKGGLSINSLGHEGEKHERWQIADIAVLPSRHEGGPYAQLEAMATNKRIVSFKSGYFKHDVSADYGWFTSDLYWRTFRDLITKAHKSANRNPREWVLENATLDKFVQQWRSFLA